MRRRQVDRPLIPAFYGGYTFGMKTAISIPDVLFREAERLARLFRTSRSQLYSNAVREYLERHDPDEITESMNRVVDELGDAQDPFVEEAAQRVLEESDW